MDDATVVVVGFVHVPVRLRQYGEANGAYEGSFLVDTGATDTMASGPQLERAGIKPVGRKTYELADGSLHDYEFGFAQIEFMGEVTVGRVIFGPEGIEPLLGVTALESAGVTIDPVSQTLKRLPAIPLK